MNTLSGFYFEGNVTLMLNNSTCWSFWSTSHQHSDVKRGFNVANLPSDVLLSTKRQTQSKAANVNVTYVTRFCGNVKLLKSVQSPRNQAKLMFYVTITCVS